jgi:hypothetical protein
MRILKIREISVIAGLTRNLMMTVKHLLTNSRGLRVKPAMTNLSSAMTDERRVKPAMAIPVAPGEALR